MPNQTKAGYGGQAVIEGVMFGGKHHYVTAIRRNDQTIDYFHLPRKTQPLLSKLKKIPFLRGIIAIIEASANGSKHLNFATELFEVNPEDDEKIIEEKKKSDSKLTMWLGIAAVGVISFFFGKVIFTLLPVFLAEFMRPLVP